jgi:hypothetical protein
MSLFDLKMISGVVLGGILQFIFSTRKTLKLLFVITISTWFIAFFIIDPLMYALGVRPNDPLRVAVLSLCGLISVETITLTIKLLPEVMRERVVNSLHIGSNNDV